MEFQATFPRQGFCATCLRNRGKIQALLSTPCGDDLQVPECLVGNFSVKASKRGKPAKAIGHSGIKSHAHSGAEDNYPYSQRATETVRGTGYGHFHIITYSCLIFQKNGTKVIYSEEMQRFLQLKITNKTQTAGGLNGKRLWVFHCATQLACLGKRNDCTRIVPWVHLRAAKKDFISAAHSPASTPSATAVLGCNAKGAYRL